MFTPAIPLSGLAGLRFLEKTGEAQRAAHENSPEIQRNIAYYAENITSVTSVEELVSDRRLLTVALGAYGLGDEIDKRAFIERVLEGGVADQNSLANRLNEQRYRQMTEDFRFDAIPRTVLSSFRDKVISKYLDQSFEIAVGEQDQSLRLALDFKRRAPETAERGWFALLGDAPARAVLETALGIPSDAASLDIDKQKELFEERAQRLLGTKDPEALNDSAIMDKIVSRYLVLDQANNGPTVTTPGYTALTLLQSSSGFGPSASLSLFNSSL